MIFNALLVAITYYLINLLKSVGISHINRPIVVGPIIGLVLGDLHTGIIVGATLESIFLGVIAVGGSAPAEPTIATVIGAAIVILTKANISAVTAMAVPVAMLGMIFLQFTGGVILPLFVPKVDAYAEKGDASAVRKLHWIMTFIQGALQAVTVFLAIWLGSNSIQMILNKIPATVTHGLAAGAGILPAVGFALLLNMLYNKKVFPFFILGFVLVVYLNLPSLAIAILAVIYAVINFNNSQDNHKSAVLNGADAGSVNVNSEEDFFNE